jgi:phosphocarrier protein
MIPILSVPPTLRVLIVCGDDHQILKEVEIVNRQGLHARPVMKFVDLACSFQAAIVVDRGNGTEQVDGKSPMHMMLLAAPQGARLRIIARGDDAQAAVDALAALITGGFGE